ncbi:methyl-accepting chemotaxis protein [Aneurinibacillus danicus]|jgi:methyl-accepting chemotaxis protein|uniref:Methyl-accepting chemotaxis protein n=1 Tax=Aneurinibacillus danicus TaxID=267746 RepID=A0A511V8Z7_9BACL|nr:methyl-accepting chemotaxis protein [Aneurinibacillus danicus]GEN34358.1 methyl-accepting chemotaxis protein [Aneurinibacillus danicus]
MRVTIQTKLLISFILLAILAGVIGGLSYNLTSQTKKTYSDLIDKKAEVRLKAKSIEANIFQQNSNLYSYLLTQNEQFKNSLSKSSNQINQLIQSTLPLLTTEEDKRLLTEIKQLSEPYEKNINTTIELAENRLDLAQRKAIETVIPLGKIISDTAIELADRQEKLMQNERERSNAIIASASNMNLIFSIFIFVLSIAIGLYISRSISKPIRQVNEAVKVVANGDLTQTEIIVKNRDEVGELAASFNQMSQNLRELIREVGTSAEQVAASSEQLTASAEESTQAASQISAAIQEVAFGSENQLQGTEESAIAIEEVTQGLQKIAQSSQSVSETSAETAKSAEQGNKAIQQTINQMNEIQNSVNHSVVKVKLLNERSMEIKKIIDVITDISSQTNLLALNAAIEAARAGEHGKGFAVVADEVRKLAEQSSASADQIIELIRDIESNLNETIGAMDLVNKNVEIGVDVAGESGKAFEKILRAIEEVASQIQEVSSISEQLSANSQQVNASVQSIATIAKQVTSNSQNVVAASEEQSASMEEVTASASSLANMAENLQQTISKFKI